MNNGIYGIAGVWPDRTKNNGVIDSEKEVYALLQGMPESERLAQILSRFALKQNTPTVIEVTDITALTGAQLDALRNGDMVVKITGTQKHTYIVTYKDETAGELLLTYCDWQNVEGVYYEKQEGTWTYVQTDYTHISQ